MIQTYHTLNNVLDKWKKKDSGQGWQKSRKVLKALFQWISQMSMFILKYHMFVQLHVSLLQCSASNGRPHCFCLVSFFPIIQIASLLLYSNQSVVIRQSVCLSNITKLIYLHHSHYGSYLPNKLHLVGCSFTNFEKSLTLKKIQSGLISWPSQSTYTSKKKCSMF